MVGCGDGTEGTSKVCHQSSMEDSAIEEGVEVYAALRIKISQVPTLVATSLSPFSSVTLMA